MNILIIVPIMVVLFGVVWISRLLYEEYKNDNNGFINRNEWLP